MAVCKPSEQYLDQLRQRYRRARKKERGRILDEFVATTHYHRKHAVALLRGKRRHRHPKMPIRRLRRRIYLAEDKRAVLWLAKLFDHISSKRLRAAMNAELDNLVAGHLEISRACFKRLKRISPSTLDRLRRTERRPAARHRGGTKPGMLLKSQIKVRTFADWDDKRPGFEEIDSVQHDGRNPSGFFACTLNQYLRQNLGDERAFVVELSLPHFNSGTPKAHGYYSTFTVPSSHSDYDDDSPI